jgi:Alginate export
MTKLVQVLLLALPIAVPAQALAASTAPNGWAMSGSLRLRGESLQGQPRAAHPEEDQWTSTRATLDLRYRAERFSVVTELWDSRVWNAGQDSTVSANDVNTLELVQAYVQADTGGWLGEGSLSSLQAGRFMLNLASRRLVAADDFRNTTNGVTGLRFDLSDPHKGSASIFYTLPQQRRPDALDDVLDQRIRNDDEGWDQRLYGATWLAPADSSGGKWELLWVGFEEQDTVGRPTRDRRLDTLDLRHFSEPQPGQWDWELEIARQTGSASNGTAPTARQRDVEAHFLHARIGYQWAVEWRPRLAFDFDAVEGDRQGRRNTRFDTLFGIRRADFAPSGLYNLVGRANLVSPGLRLELTPSARNDFMATVRGLWLESATDGFSTLGLRDATAAAGRHAGTQWDLRYRHWLVPRTLRLEVNAIQLAQGAWLREVPGSRGRSGTGYLAVSLQTNW